MLLIRTHSPTVAIKDIPLSAMFMELQIKTDESTDTIFEGSPNKVPLAKKTINKNSKFFKWTNRETRWSSEDKKLIFRFKDYDSSARWDAVVQWCLRNKIG